MAHNSALSEGMASYESPEFTDRIHKQAAGYHFGISNPNPNAASERCTTISSDLDSRNPTVQMRSSTKRYPAFLINVFAVGLAATAAGLLGLVVGFLHSTYPVQLCSALILSIGTILIAWTLLRGQALIERF